MSFEKLLAPRSVAVIGASTNPAKVGHSVLYNIVSGGFEGEVYPINPGAESILDRRAYPSVKDVPGEIDLAVVVVKRDLVLPVLRECRGKGTTAAIIITAGFGESDEQGRKLQKQIAQLGRESRMTIVGPNCLGVINPWIKLNAAFGQGAGEAGHVALVSQSGALITAIQDWAATGKVGFSVVASIGNKACIDEVDFLEQLRKDEHTRVVAAYIEDISRGQEFMRIAERVSKEKPVVVLKSGRTTAGAKAASSHTGSLAGADAAYGCAFARTGVIRVESIEHLFDVASAFSSQPLPAGDRIAVVTNAGGPGIMMSDALEMAGLQVGHIDKGTGERLSEVLPPAASVHNPVDVLGDADSERYRTAVEILLRSETVDGLVVILTPQKMTEDEATAKAIVELSAKYGKPVMTCFMGTDTVARGIHVLREGKVPQYTVPERAAKAMKEMVRYGSYRRRPLRVIERFAVNKNPVIKMIRGYRSRGQLEIGEIDAKTIMRAYHFDMPPGMAAASVEDAVRYSEQLRYPLAMKISSPDILHKSDVGGVRVGLNDAGDVEDAFELMMLRVRRKMPDAEIRGVLIEQMVTGGREVILGMKKDAQFGPMLMFGLGGIFVEVLKDVSFGLAPVTREECRDMIFRTRSHKLLTGVRGKAPYDIGAIVENMARLSQLVVDFPEIDEIDINPLMVGHEGDGASVVDARIIIAGEDKS